MNSEANINEIDPEAGCAYQQNWSGSRMCIWIKLILIPDVNTNEIDPEAREMASFSRYRGREAGRGDIDEALGNFSLTLIDSLDMLVVLGRIEEFEDAVLKVQWNP